MNKRQLHHFYSRFRRIKPWYFLVLAVVSGFIGILALRSNNQHMAELRDAVYAADKNNGDVQTALRNLQNYVTSHMNTDLTAGNSSVYPPIQLKYTYERLVQAQQSSRPGSTLYTEAQQFCEQQNPAGFSGGNRIACIEQYVQSHKPAEVPQIPDALYKFAFASPSWSPDLAGWSMVVAILSLLLFVASFIVNKWLRRASR